MENHFDIIHRADAVSRLPHYQEMAHMNGVYDKFEW